MVLSDGLMLCFVALIDFDFVLARKRQIRYQYLCHLVRYIIVSGRVLDMRPFTQNEILLFANENENYRLISTSLSDDDVIIEIRGLSSQHRNNNQR